MMQRGKQTCAYAGILLTLGLASAFVPAFGVAEPTDRIEAEINACNSDMFYAGTEVTLRQDPRPYTISFDHLIEQVPNGDGTPMDQGYKFDAINHVNAYLQFLVQDGPQAYQFYVYGQVGRLCDIIGGLVPET